MELIGGKLCIRPLSSLDFTQHLSVVSPQLCDALEKRTVVDAAFTESLIIVLARDSLQALSLDLRKHLRPYKRGDAAVLLRTNLPYRMQRPCFTGLRDASRATVNVKRRFPVSARRKDDLQRGGFTIGHEKRPMKFNSL
jgi:hypothetical protein